MTFDKKMDKKVNDLTRHAKDKEIQIQKEMSEILQEWHYSMKCHICFNKNQQIGFVCQNCSNWICTDCQRKRTVTETTCPCYYCRDTNNFVKIRFF
jgi:hypothetical protein